jgi:O-antigen/teichoic acid export membrane protein
VSSTPAQPSASYLRILNRGAIYSISILGARAASMLLVPIYTHYLDTAQYGVLELMDLTVNVVSLLTGFRLGQAMMYYYAAAADDRERRSYVCSSFLGSLMVGLAVALACISFSGVFSRLVLGSTAYTGYFRLSFASSALSLPVEVGLALYRAQDRAAAFVWLSLGRIALTGALNILLLVKFGMGIGAFLWSSLIGSGVLVVYLAFHVFHTVGLHFNRKHFAAVLGYWAPLGLSAIAFFFVHYADRFFLLPQVSLGAIGIYSLAYKIGMLVSYVQTPFALFWNAQMFGIVKAADGEQKYVRICTYIVLILTYATLGIVVFAQPLLGLTVAKDYQAGAALVPLLAVAYWARAVAGHIMGVFLLEKQTMYEARVSWIGAVVCLGGYLLLIPRFKVWGAAWATMITFAVMLIFAMYYGQRVRRFHFEYRRLAQMIALAVIVIAATFAFRGPNPWRQLFYAVGASLAYPLLLAATGFVAKDEYRESRRIALQLWNRLKPLPARG